MPVGVPCAAVTVAVSKTAWPYTALVVDVVSVVVVPWTVEVTSWLIALDVLPPKFRPSPAYTAVTVWLPTVKLFVVRLAMPPIRLTWLP